MNRRYSLWKIKNLDLAFMVDKGHKGQHTFLPTETLKRSGNRGSIHKYKSGHDIDTFGLYKAAFRSCKCLENSTEGADF